MSFKDGDMGGYADCPDIEEIDHLLARALCSYEFGDDGFPLDGLAGLAQAAHAFGKLNDGLTEDDWVSGNAILAHLRQSLAQRGCSRVLALTTLPKTMTIYKHTVDCAADGIAERMGEKRKRRS